MPTRNNEHYYVSQSRYWGIVSIYAHYFCEILFLEFLIHVVLYANL